MNLIDEIREHFASASNGKGNSIRKIESIPEKYPAFTIEIDNEFGVAIPYGDGEDISENFSNSRLYSEILRTNDDGEKYIILSCNQKNLRYEFASLCFEFVDPGDKGKNRKLVLEQPLVWRDKWKEILGNAIVDRSPYSVIAEMYVLYHLYKKDKSVDWAAIHAGRHDIEGDKGSYEVKSTIQRYGEKITISGQFQLNYEKRLQLYFCRMERSKSGISINDMEKALLDAGYDRDKLEKQITSLGYHRGNSDRKEKYEIIERRLYEIDDSFPQITPKVFKGGKIPDAITHITYEVSLDGIDYSVWE